MQITLRRIARRDKYTIGKLYIDGKYFCDTLEDRDRGLKQSMDLSEISKLKIKNETAIPVGTYAITLSVISPKYSLRSFYKTYANGGRVPRLINVKGYEGVLIHSGNTDKDTSGCILIGQNKVVGKVINSQETFKKFYKILQSTTDKITLTIE